MWVGGDGEMVWKDSDGLGKYRQGTTTKLRAYRRSGVMRMAEKVSEEDNGGRARWQICGTTGIDMTVKEMQDVNKRDVKQRRWENGLEEQRRTGKYQQETTTNLRMYRRSNTLGVRATADLHDDSVCIWILCVSYCNLNKITC